MRLFQQNITITIALNIIYNSISVILSTSWWIHMYMLVQGVFLPSIFSSSSAVLYLVWTIMWLFSILLTGMSQNWSNTLWKRWFYNWFGPSCKCLLSSLQAWGRIYPRHCERDDGEIEFKILKHYQKLHRNGIYYCKNDPFVFRFWE